MIDFITATEKPGFLKNRVFGMYGCRGVVLRNLVFDKIFIV